LAPLYDLASALPYPGMRPIGLRLAMKIGGDYRLRNIEVRHWNRLAQEVHQNPDELLANLRAKAGALADHTLAVQKRVKSDGLRHALIDRLSERLIARARESQRMLK
jgi:serine/threonine-protein kinase HipA